MTSRWLQLALDTRESASLSPLCANSANSAKSPDPERVSTPFGTIGTIGTASGEDRNASPGEAHDLADLAEREAVLIEDAGVPAAYAGAFAALQSRIPAGVDRPRWELFIDDAARFLDGWGAEAEAAGWTPASLFGLHATAPLARYDEMGALWLFKGERCEALTAEWLRLSNGLKFYRPTGQGKGEA
jgi:hypothetical protein